MARDVIILAGITASGKSTTMERLLPAGSVKLPEGQPQMGGLPSLCFRAPASFVRGSLVARDGDSQAAFPLPGGPVVIHWGFPACKTLADDATIGLVEMASIKKRVAVVLLLACSYPCFIKRMWYSSSRRKVQFRHATDPAQVVENYERFRDGCEALGLEVRLVDTTYPGVLDFTEKSLHDVLTNGMSLVEGKTKALGLIKEAGIERIV